MGFAEIQAAFAAQGQAPAPQPAVQPPAAPVQFTPSPFGAPPVATVTAATPSPYVPTPAVQPPPPAQASFQFTPPAGFNPASAPPINPPGERAALAAPAAAPNPPVAAAPAEAPGVTAAPTSVGTTQTSAAGFSPPSAPAEPKRRGRKPGAKNAGGMPGVVAAAPAIYVDEQGGEHSHAEAAVPAVPSLAADGAAIATMPPDGSSVEDIVSELFARGVSSVHLTFTKDGK